MHGFETVIVAAIAAVNILNVFMFYVRKDNGGDSANPKIKINVQNNVTYSLSVFKCVFQ